MENKIEIKGVTKQFRKKVALNNLSCELKNGIYGVLGSNGAGKTTLMRCIAGLYSYTGEIQLNGSNIQKKRIKLGYLPQQFGVFPELTVYQMMQYFCNLKGIPKKERKEQIENCLKKVNLQDVSNSMAKKLSGGMIRRVGIAQAILGNPDIVLLDEPTAGLDPEERIRFKNIINTLIGERIILISTHIVEDVEACCDHVLVMKAGEIIFNGPISDIRDYASGRIREVSEREIAADDILFVEKSYLKEEEKAYRVILKSKQDASLMPTVEDGYLCLLKEK